MIKEMISRFNKPYDMAKVTLSNMKLRNIPQLPTQVYLKIKQNRHNKSTDPVSISENHMAWWDEPITITCRVPKASSLTSNSSKRNSKLNLHISIRLVDQNSHSNSRYGSCEFELRPIDCDDFTFSTKLNKCNYKSEFTCTVSTRPKELDTSQISITEEQFNSSSNNQYDGVNDLRNLSDFGGAFASVNYNPPSSSEANEYSSDDTLLNYQVKSSTLTHHKPSTFSLDDDEDGGESSEKSEKLPFEVSDSEMKELSKQVDDIITQILYSHSE